MENQLSLWLLSPLQVKELEEGAVCFEELKAEELRSCLVYLVWDMGTRVTSR